MDIDSNVLRAATGDVQALVGDCTDLFDFADDSVDVVFASNLLEHPERAQAKALLAEAARVLTPIGRLILMQPNFRLDPGSSFDDFTHVAICTDRSLSEYLVSLYWRIDRVYLRFLPLTVKNRVSQLTFLVPLYLRSPVKPLAWQMLVVALPRRCEVHVPGASRARADDVVANARSAGSGFGLEMLLLAILRPARILQFPVNFHPRVGEPSVTGHLGKAIRLGADMVGMVLRYRLSAPRIRCPAQSSHSSAGWSGEQMGFTPTDPDQGAEQAGALLEPEGVTDLGGEYWATYLVDYLADDRFDVRPDAVIRFLDGTERFDPSPEADRAFIYTAGIEPFLALPADDYELVQVAGYDVYLPRARPAAVDG